MLVSRKRGHMTTQSLGEETVGHRWTQGGEFGHLDKSSSPL